MSKKFFKSHLGNIDKIDPNKLPFLEKTWSKQNPAATAIQTLPPRQEAAVQTENPPPHVIAVMPAFNAEQTIRQTHAAIPSQHVHQIIVVDDASHDNTVAVSRSLDNVVVITHETNRGYGGNQKTCYSEALRRGADVVVMIHPDFQYDPRYLPQLTQLIINGQADFVIGSRFLGQDPRKSGMDWWRYKGNRFLTGLQNKALGINLSECHSGYRAYSRRFLQKIPYMKFSDDFVFDSQMIAAAAWFKFRIAEVGIPTRYTSKSSSISFARSVRYGLATLTTVLPYNRRQLEEACPVCHQVAALYLVGTHRPDEYFQQQSYRIAAGAGKERLAVFRCQSCRHGFTPISGAAQGIEKWYRQSKLDETFLAEDLSRRKSANVILDQIEQYHFPPGRLLEVGAGPGLLLSEASKRGWDTTGIEPSEASVAYARDRLKLTDFRHGNHQLLNNMAPASYTIVCLLDVLEHVVDPLELLKGIQRVLKPGGVCVMTTPRFDSSVAKIMGRRWYCIFPAHLNYFTRSSLALILKQANLQVLAVRSHTRYFSPGYLWRRFRRLGGEHPNSSSGNINLQIPIRLGDEFEVYAGKPSS